MYINWATDWCRNALSWHLRTFLNLYDKTPTRTDKAWITQSVYAHCHSIYCETNFCNVMTSTTTYNPHSRNHLLALNLWVQPPRSLAQGILDLSVTLPFALLVKHCSPFQLLLAPSFLTSHSHRPGIQTVFVWERCFRAGPAQLFMEIFLLEVSSSHLSIWRQLLWNSTFIPDSAAGSRNCISDVEASLIECD